jgi:predicted enzyme related to lactoylglutathione lyase
MMHPGLFRTLAFNKPQPQGILRLGLLALLLGVAFSAPAKAEQRLFSPLVESASAEHHVGKLIFVELATPDVEAAKQFYGELFGWTFHDIHFHGAKYAEAFVHGRPVAGLIQKNPAGNQQRLWSWLSFFAVSDVEEAKSLALKHGGRLLIEPHNIPGRGEEAVFTDPQGAVFAVLASETGDQADMLALPGEWIWSSLLTTQPGKAAAFYQNLFDYEVYELEASGETLHLQLASDNYARASVNSLPVSSSYILPHWLNYIRVDDAVKTSAKLVALGGRVLVEPKVDRHGGKIAVVADPFGAAFGLMEWTATDSKEVVK